MQWKDAEQQSWLVKMYDLASGDNNPYNLNYSVADNGDGTQTVTVNWLTIPAGCTGVRIEASADGGSTFPYLYNFPATTSPGVWATLPAGDYLYLLSFIVPVPGDNEQFVLNELAEQYEELTPTGHPLDIYVVNNDVNKFQQVKAKQAVLRFLSTATINLNSFRTGAKWDSRFYAEVFKNSRAVLKGFPILDDVGEPFLDKRNEVNITITDRLGTLKERELKDLDGTVPNNEKRLAAIVAMALRKTGMNLPVNIVSNLREEHCYKSVHVDFVAGINEIQVVYDNADGFFVAGHVYKFSGSAANDGNYTAVTVTTPLSFLTVLTVAGPLTAEVDAICVIEDITNSGNWFDKMYQDMKTYESDEVGTRIDCYAVLERLLGFHGFITQEKGEWWIINMDERDVQPFYVTRFDSEGNFVEDQAAQVFEKTFGRTQALKFIDKAAGVRLARALEFIKLTYNYEYFKEIICNINFERGALQTTISADEKRYAVDCWTLKRGIGPSATTPNCSTYIRRLFNDGYETERYLVITSPASNAAPINYQESESFHITQKDKFDFSFDYKWSGNPGTSSSISINIATIRLEGDDGTHWTLDSDGKWYQSNTDWTTFFKALQAEWEVGDEDETEFRSISVEAKAAPVTGKIYIMLYAMNQLGSSIDNYDVHYNNLSLDYKPFINGSYRQFSGQYNKVTVKTDADKYFNNLDEQIYLSDSPRKTFKGALLRYNGTNYELAGKFYNAAVFHTSPPPAEYFHKWSYIQAFSVWNQRNKIQGIINFSALGLSGNATDAQDRDDTPGLIHNYLVATASPHSTNKKFALVSYRMDCRTCKWSGVLMEVLDMVNGKVYLDTHEFKFKEA